MVQSAIGCLEVDDSRVPGRRGPVVVAAPPEDIQLTATSPGGSSRQQSLRRTDHLRGGIC
jgi:hypothetical protein